MTHRDERDIREYSNDTEVSRLRAALLEHASKSGGDQRVANVSG